MDEEAEQIGSTGMETTTTSTTTTTTTTTTTPIQVVANQTQGGTSVSATSTTNTTPITAANATDTGSALAAALSKMVLKKDKPRIPTFSGRDRTRREPSFSEWYYIVQKAMQQQGSYNLSDRELNDLIFASLTGEARSRFIRMETENKSTIQTMKVVYEGSTTAIDRLQSLHAVKQLKNESVTEFADRLEKTAYWCEQATDQIPFKRDETMKVIFLKGLNNRRIADKMEHYRDNENKSYEDVRSKAINLESESKPGDSQSNIQSVNQTSELKAAVESLTKQMEELRASIQNQPQRQPSERPANKNGPIKCWYCNQTGHTSRYCFKKRDDMKKNPSQSSEDKSKDGQAKSTN